MGIFSKRSRNPEFSRFSSDHFKNGVKRILWEGEKLIADGFFEDGPDPFGEEDALKGIFGGNSHTYLAATTWRVILGYLANGDFSSHTYADSEPGIRKSAGNFYFTYSNPILKASDSPTFRSTYSVSKEVAEAIDKNSINLKPTKIEETQFYLTRKSWGVGPMAELAKIKSGRDYMVLEVCTACTGTMLAPDGIETSLDKGNLLCGSCLRMRVKK